MLIACASGHRQKVARRTITPCWDRTLNGYADDIDSYLRKFWRLAQVPLHRTLCHLPTRC